MDIVATLNNIVNWALGFLLVFATLMIIVAGYQFVSAMGDPEKIRKARFSVLWALIGVAVGLGSKVLVDFIQKYIVK